MKLQRERQDEWTVQRKAATSRQRTTQQVQSPTAPALKTEKILREKLHKSQSTRVVSVRAARRLRISLSPRQAPRTSSVELSQAVHSFSEVQAVQCTGQPVQKVLAAFAAAAHAA